MAAALSAALCGCAGENRSVDTVMADVNPFGWLDEKVILFDNADTAARVDIALVARVADASQADRLTLDIEFMAPDSTLFVERKLFPLPHSRRSTPALEVVEIPYRRNAIFSQRGCYTVRLQPVESVKGVEAVGFKFEKTE